ncbi:MAG: hypothetical protein IKX24_06685 [Prevotella sp.]|nr:hypothetical protein [Prevotella sp.]
MRKIYYYSMMLAVLTLVWGCGSSDGDDPYTPEPTPAQKWVKTEGSANWAIDWSFNDPAPEWVVPHPEQYESWMILMVTLQPELVPYSSENDLMAVFIRGDVRAVAHPAISMGDTNDVTFILKVLGNEVSDEAMDMQLGYYCSKLKLSCILAGSNRFVAEYVYGVDKPFVPNLLSGNTKYYVQMPLTLQMPRTAQDVIQPSKGDLVAVMVGDECRGVVALDEHLFLSPYYLTAYARQEGETGTIYYFNAQQNTIWNTGQTVSITSTPQTVTINY